MRIFPAPSRVMSSASKKTFLNPVISDFVNSQIGKAKFVAEQGSMRGWILVTVLIAFTIGLFVWLYRRAGRLEYASNVSRLAYYGSKRGNQYTDASKRKTLRQYLETLQAQGVPASHMALTNFYFSTANGAGFFFSEDKGSAIDGVFSPQAAQLAAQAGARAFVFDVWPDLRPDANFAPVLQVVEEGSKWRRISLNAIHVSTAIKPIIDTLMVNGLRGSDMSKEVVIFYFRFRGVPRLQTYAGVAATLRSMAEQYRLDSSFSAARGQTRLFRTPITEFFGKIIVGSNVTAAGTPLQDYINFVGAATMFSSEKTNGGIRAEWSPSELVSQTEDMKRESISRIQQNLSITALPLENSASQKNELDWKAVHTFGVHMAAMNFFNANTAQMKEYLSADNFGTFGYKIKPVNLRYAIEVLPEPRVPENPGWGQGQTAGTIHAPETIRDTV